MAKAEKKPRKLTPIGEARWSHVFVPKAAFDGKGEGKFMIDVVFDPTEPEWEKWVKDLTGKVLALPTQINKKTGEKMPKQSPIKRDLDQAEEPTGKLYCTFKTGEKFPPVVFDKYGKRMAETKIGNGSKVQICYTEAEYEGFGGGISLYLNSLQVKELHEYGGSSAESYGFDVEADPEETMAPF